MLGASGESSTVPLERTGDERRVELKLVKLVAAAQLLRDSAAQPCEVQLEILRDRMSVHMVGGDLLRMCDR